MINILSELIHKNAKDKGFFDGEVNIGERIALIHSEVSEALEADRKGMYCTLSPGNLTRLTRQDNNEQFKADFLGNIKDTFEDELADAMIRIMDLAAYKGIDLEKHIEAKMRYNSTRPNKHGKRY